MRRTRIIRRRRVVNRRPRRRRRRVRRRGQRENKIQIYRGMLPPTAYIKHRYTRQIRLEEPYQLPECTPTQGLQGTPCVLIASCNNPMGPLNQIAPPGAPPQSPAFLESVGLSAAVWDRNRYPMLWQFLQRQYSQWTVVGSKIRITYRPDQAPSVLNRDGATPLLEFTLLSKASQYVVGATTPITTASFPTNNYYPSLVKEQPGAYTKSWSANNLYSRNAITMSRNFSARKAFGKSKGNVVGESNLQGQASAAPGTGSQILVGGNVPEEQYYWHLYINPAVGSTGVTSSIPPGMFTVTIEYGTVWTERSDLPDN